MTTSSIPGRCGSSPDKSRPASSDNSASEPTHVKRLCPHSQSGSGVPQYLVRDSVQSTLSRSQPSYLAHLLPGGCQLIFVLSAISRSLIAVVRMYQDGMA